MFSWLISRRGLSLLLMVGGVGLVVASYSQQVVAEGKYWWNQHQSVSYSVDQPQSSSSSQVQVIQPQSLDYGLVIEKIGLNQTVATGVNPYDPNEYLPILKVRGVAEARGSAKPGRPGTTYIFGHSTVNLLDIGRYHAPFTLLNKLTVGDRIVVFYDGQRYNYEITDMPVVAPSEVHYLTDVRQNPTLIVQTCDPPGSNAKRLLVIATRM